MYAVFGLTRIENVEDPDMGAEPHPFTKDIVKLLIEHSAAIQPRDSDGCTALHRAVHMDGEISELLISKGADIEAKDNGGRSPLFYAAEADKGFKHGAKLLFEKMQT